MKEDICLDNSEWYDRILNKILDEYHDDPELDPQFWEIPEKKTETSGDESKAWSTAPLQEASHHLPETGGFFVLWIQLRQRHGNFPRDQR